MKFYLGTHQPHWLWKTTVPLFVSQTTLGKRASFQRATCNWALDSGGYSQLRYNGEWTITPERYVTSVRNYRQMRNCTTDISHSIFHSKEEKMISGIHPPDEHALFPHKIVTAKSQKIHRDARGRIIGKEDYYTTYLVCVTCGHWSNRLLISACYCRSSCHDEMAERLAFQAQNLIDSESTNQTEAREAENVRTDQHQDHQSRRKVRRHRQGRS